MRYIAAEDIARAKEMDLLTYLRNYEPQELVHVSGNTYCTREHDSLRISNGKWCWFSQGIGGRSALDYLIKVKGIPFIEYDLSIGDVLSPIYTLLFDLALKEALGRTASQGNVYLIVDELKLLPNLRHLEDGINFGRSLGVKILAGLQSIDQLTFTIT